MAAAVATEESATCTGAAGLSTSWTGKLVAATLNFKASEINLQSELIHFFSQLHQ